MKFNFNNQLFLVFLRDHTEYINKQFYSLLAILLFQKLSLEMNIYNFSAQQIFQW